MEEGTWYEPQKAEAEQTFVWETSEDDAKEEVLDEVIVIAKQTENSNPTVVWTEARRKMFRVTNDFIAEGGRQYQTSVLSSGRLGKETAASLLKLAGSSWQFLKQPVWVPGRRNEPKQYSRGALFALDIVRFGGTFASLFVVLFVGLNYQSFWSIAQSYVDPLAEVTGAKNSTDDTDSELAEKLKKIPSLTVAGEEDSMVDYLPLVGPPENRIIIPKLNLNVPIVIPPNDALIAEDWENLEKAIQAGLQDGVVHYPGTARPGQAGNFFVTGHSSYFPWAEGSFKSVFARLHLLKPGDEYWVFYRGDRYRYIIQSKKEIRPSDVSVLDQPINRRIATLMTCTPVGTTLRRLIITAQEVDPVTGLALDVGEHRKEEELPKVKMEMLPI